MVSITQLRQAMATANLSYEGRAKLEALVTDAPPHGVQILLENSPAANYFEDLLNKKTDLRFAILSREDMAALAGLRQLDTGVTLYSDGVTTSVVAMLNVYNDALDAEASAR